MKFIQSSVAVSDVGNIRVVFLSAITEDGELLVTSYTPGTEGDVLLDEGWTKVNVPIVSEIETYSASINKRAPKSKAD